MGNNETPYRNESSKRIQYLIDTYCDGSQQVFADKCKIGKSSVSQYVKGTNAPTNLRAIQISKVFNVNPVWIMGFDAPMISEKEVESTLTDAERALLDGYRKLDAIDQAEIRGTLRGLLLSDKYKKEEQKQA